MIIPPTRHAGIPPSAPDPHRPSAGSPLAQTDRVTLNQRSRLEGALKQTPAIRPEVVARGRDLANDPAYPPLEIINRLATLITASQDQSLED